MAALGLGLDVYGSDDDEEASLAESVGGAGVVLMGGYLDPAARDDAESAQLPASDSVGGAEAMEVDAAPGASPVPGGSTANALPPPSPGGGPAEEEAGGLPPELARPPPGDCDPKVKDKVERYLRVRREQGREIKSELRHARGYRNPDFLQKMVDHTGIISSGSNFPKDVFNTENLHEEDFYEALKTAWEREQERRAAERAASGRIDFTSGGGKHSAGAPRPSSLKPQSAGASDVAAVVQKARAQAAAAAAKAKGSRWDNK